MKGISSIWFISVFLTLSGLAEHPVPYLSIKTKEIEINDSNDNQKTDYRLPMNGLIVSHYDLTIRPNLKNFTFSGEVNISINTANKSRKNIVLHAKELEIKKDISMQCGLSELLAKNIYMDVKRDFLVIEFNKELESYQDCVLHIKYSGKINDQLRGFYRSSYVNDQQKTVWLAATHFEPVGARQAFPCFDEPALKATFGIQIEHQRTFNTVLSNTVGMTYHRKSDNISVTRFEKTPRMSTYLVAFMVSDFKSVANANDVNFKVWARPNEYQNGQFAVSIGYKILKILEEFTNKRHTISKMDQIALPDFLIGGMENWGLVTYKEAALLYSNRTSSILKQNIAVLIAHEFSHQWFGDLVSPTWWKYAWLKEGMANFFGYYIANKAFPEWRLIERQVVEQIQDIAFIFDSGDKSHPLNYDVHSPQEVIDVFDKITYQKGGSVIRMIQHFLTEPVFQAGLQKYLNKNQFNVADSDALIEGWQSAIEDKNFDLKTKLDSWINRAGYPVVMVTVANNGSVTISQEQFYSKKRNDMNVSKEENAQWWIPINYATRSKLNNDTKPTMWLEPGKKLQFYINASEWIIVNIQQTGYYRVDYNEENWKRIIQCLKSKDRKDIHVLNRAQLINDALAFAKVDRMSYKTLLDLSTYLVEETDYIVWYQGHKLLEYLKQNLTNTDIYEDYNSNVQLESLANKADISYTATSTAIANGKENLEWIKNNKHNIWDWMRKFKKEN